MAKTKTKTSGRVFLQASAPLNIDGASLSKGQILEVTGKLSEQAKSDISTFVRLKHLNEVQAEPVEDPPEDPPKDPPKE